MKKINVSIIINLILVFALLFSISISGLSAEKVIKWKLQSACASGDFSFEGAKRFAEQVAEASDGRLEINVFPSGAIIPSGKEFEGVIAGTVDSAMVACGWTTGYVPAGIFYSNWVGGLTGNQQMMWMDYAGKKLARELYNPFGAYFVDLLTVHPAEVWCHSKKPLHSVEDLKGLKIRMGTTALNNIFRRMGASPVFLPGGEVYEAAKRGLIDAFEYVSPSVNWSLGFQEVAKYLYLSPSRAPSDAFALFVNMDTWNALPSDLQKIVEMVTHEVTRRFYLESVLNDSIALDKFKEYGTIIEKVPEDIEELLYKKANEYYTEECAKDSNYKKVYESAVKFREICNQAGIK